MAGMTKAPYILRPGRPEDVAAAVAIDDAAFALYAEVGITIDLGADHPLVRAEEKAWRHAAQSGGLVFAELETDHARAGFFVLGEMDGTAHLEQIAVLPAYMRQGIGTVLMNEAIAMARARGAAHLVLTTYDHVPWNGPYYETLGFERVPTDQIGPATAALHDLYRQHLPQPDHRVVMRKLL